VFALSARPQTLLRTLTLSLSPISPFLLSFSLSFLFSPFTLFISGDKVSSRLLLDDCLYGSGKTIDLEEGRSIRLLTSSFLGSFRFFSPLEASQKNQPQPEHF